MWLGIITCVYLNSVYPQKYKDGEYFYIYLYAKESNAPMNFILNGKNASFVKELTPNNEFTSLTDSKDDWQNYYLVKFAPQKATQLKLIAKIANFSSNPIIFQKEN
ncbi:MAG: hypothetical protein Q9M40_12995 [Sulfurimonas sp.]|nr:hypothetical protein [Sulfurimonas sp.]